MKTPLSLFLMLMGFVASALAHEDPRGEVHPNVTAYGDHFKVTFFDNTLPSGTNQTKSRTFSRTGELLSEQKEKADSPLFRKYSFPQLAEEQSGLERKFNDSWIVIPEYERKHGGAPFIVLLSGDTVSYKSLAWAAPNVDLIQDALIDDSFLYLLVTRINPAGKVSLWLHKFSLISFKEEAFVQLPDPSSINSFPICSNLISHNHSIYLAIVAERPGGWVLLLATWDGTTANATISKITTAIDWNTHISLANINDDFLIAYHYPGAQEGLLASFFPKKSKVRIRHLDLGQVASASLSQTIIWSLAGCALFLTYFCFWRRRRRPKGPSHQRKRTDRNGTNLKFSNRE